MNRRYSDLAYTCLYASIQKIADGANVEIVAGYWEFPLCPGRGIELEDDLVDHMRRHGRQLGSAGDRPAESTEGRHWTSAGCHTSFFVKGIRTDFRSDVIEIVCDACGEVAKEPMTVHQSKDNEKRLFGRGSSHGDLFQKPISNTASPSIVVPESVSLNERGYSVGRPLCGPR
ncbi:unnamed protein product [Amoebophrya sp. A25]|nr:unnamed protein product [Amoebophrya sp. A25]|eukprot:GSA25T00025512001.1